MLTYDDALDNKMTLVSEVMVRLNVLYDAKISKEKISQITGLNPSQLSSFKNFTLVLSYERLLRVLKRLDALGIYYDNYYNITDEAIKEIQNI